MKSDQQWKKELTSKQYHILRRKGTERAFTGTYWNHKGDGLYRCAGCDNPLFDSKTKYTSGTGWPSFYAVQSKTSVSTEGDTSLGVYRDEVVCARCGGHLGHVFDDGPRPTGKRFCINSEALRFEQRRPRMDADGPKARAKVAIFGAGCFWGVEAAFGKVKGVVETSVGYSGGTTAKPTYKQVCNGRTGHAEVVRVLYDPAKVSYAELLKTFWSTHNPTQGNRQGWDFGSQYRSAVFYTDEDQKQIALAYKARLEKAKTFKRPITTEITKAGPYYAAEDYHQKYYQKRGMKGCGIR